MSKVHRFFVFTFIELIMFLSDTKFQLRVALSLLSRYFYVGIVVRVFIHLHFEKENIMRW